MSPELLYGVHRTEMVVVIVFFSAASYVYSICI